MTLFWFMLLSGVLSKVLAADIPLMPDTQETWIARNIDLDGVQASIKSIRHRAPIDTVVEFYRHAWSRKGRVQVSGTSEQQVIATQQRNEFISLQLESGPKGTYGVLIISELPIPGLQEDVPLSIPPGAIVLSAQTHRDGMTLTETVTLQSRNNPQLFSADLVTHWQTQGWTLTRDEPAAVMPHGRRLNLSKGADRLVVFIAQDERWKNVTLAFIVKKPAE